MITSDCLASSKNLFPKPLPEWAPGTKPAISTNFIGMNLIPLIHRELLGLSSTPNSLQTQLILTKAMPTLGSIVVNGKLAICTDKSVAELKNVDLPTLAFPNKPIINYNLF